MHTFSLNTFMIAWLVGQKTVRLESALPKSKSTLALIAKSENNLNAGSLSSMLIMLFGPAYSTTMIRAQA